MEVNAEGLLLTISETSGGRVSGGVSVGMLASETASPTTAASDAARAGSGAAGCAEGAVALPGRKRGAGAAPAAGSDGLHAVGVAAAAALAAAKAANAARFAEESVGQYMGAAPARVALDHALKCGQAADAAVSASEAASEAASCVALAATGVQVAKRPRQQSTGSKCSPRMTARCVRRRMWR